jgi:hypothetical protein
MSDRVQDDPLRPCNSHAKGVELRLCEPSLPIIVDAEVRGSAPRLAAT